MKKLKAMGLYGKEALTREELKNVLGGGVPGSGCTLVCPAYHHCETITLTIPGTSTTPVMHCVWDK